MRTLETIQQSILETKQSINELNDLNSTSKTAIWRLWIYIMAFAIYIHEQFFDQHKKEVDQELLLLKPHTLRWYRNKALAFQYGFNLYEDSDKFNNENHTEDEIEQSKIVKYSAVTEAQNESRLIIKIAGEVNGKLNPITSAQSEAFTAYIEEIRDAGVSVTIINYLPDLLSLNITIKRNPLVLDATGYAMVPVNGIIRPVDYAIQQFLRELPFNGELVLSKLTDKIQQANGVVDVNIDSASSSWIDAVTNNYGQAIGIYMSKVPESGYFKIEDFKNIKYVV